MMSEWFQKVTTTHTIKNDSGTIAAVVIEGEGPSQANKISEIISTGSGVIPMWTSKWKTTQTPYQDRGLDLW
mgnify:FL=1